MSKEQYGVMRLLKVKGAGVIAGHQAEANRQPNDEGRFDGSDIHWEKTKGNVWLVRSDDWNRDIDKYIAEHYHGKRKIREDAVKLVEGVYTCSKEQMQELERTGQVEQFARDCMSWHEDHIGHVINAVWHGDETTGHLQIASVPMTKDGRLSAGEICGNSRKMSRLQQSVEDDVFKKYGLAHRNVREAREAKKHKDKAEYAAEKAEEELKVAQNEQKMIEQNRERTSKELQDSCAEVDMIELRAEYVESSIIPPRKEHYELSPKDFKRLLLVAKKGVEVATEYPRVRKERDIAVSGLEMSQKERDKDRQEYVQKLTDLRKDACMYLSAPVWARQNLQEDMEYYQRYRSDVDKGIVAAYCTAGDGLSHKDRLEVAGEYARPYMSRLRGEVVSKHDACEYARSCISECDRQVSGGRSSSPDTWHHRASDTDYSKPPETDDVKIPRLSKDEQSNNTILVCNSYKKGGSLRHPP